MTSSNVSDPVNISDQPWFQTEELQKILALLNHSGGEGRIAGGAVRNALMGQRVSDIDIATTLLPKEVTDRAQSEGLSVVPTGIDHGTVTVIINKIPFEVTTLRQDVATDGRHAEVVFGQDWQQDAERRDLTVNGLYADHNGNVIDLIGGLGDIKTATIRFIGDAHTRIAEDYLRVLRFFRFFAHYGSGRPDAEGLKACAKASNKLGNLSAERVWKELKLLLSAPDCGRALLWMRTTGVLTALLSETEKWGIDTIGPLMGTKADLGWEHDPYLALMAMIPPDADRVKTMAKRLKMSKAETSRLMSWAKTVPPQHDVSDIAFDKMLYRGDVSGVEDRLRLALVSSRSRALMDGDAGQNAMIEAAGYSKLLQYILNWQRPEFPVTGQDLIDNGVPSGPELGQKLFELEDKWIESHFKLTRDALLKA